MVKKMTQIMKKVKEKTESKFKPAFPFKAATVTPTQSRIHHNQQPNLIA